MNQARIWSGEFGQQYLDRNRLTMDQLNDKYRGLYKISRWVMNWMFLQHVPRTSKILEVGCGHGVQLRFLKSMGFYHFYGIDVSKEAVSLIKKVGPCGTVVQGLAENLPFEDESFDMVFTSGLLIHIPPENLSTVMKEMVRCAKRYIWGYEYYSPFEEEVEYHGQHNMLWRRDYAALFRENFRWQLFRETIYPRVSGLSDSMYLLEKPQC